MKKYPAALLSLLVVISILAGCGGPVRDSSDSNRAAIIDQLYLLESNPYFITGATRMLETCGFTVDLWQGEEITVDFYRELPEQGYKLIVLRVHSGILLDIQEEGIEPLENTYIFTGETYSTTKYVTEQLTDKVSNAMMTEDYPLVFAVNSEFIEDSKGIFKDTLIISMGCESSYLDDMPQAFTDKGASAYLGWNTLVSLEYVDAATLALLDNLCIAGMALAEGISSTMEELGHDPYFDSYLKLHPSDSGGLTVKELIE